jgi:hypothetical protein
MSRKDRSTGSSITAEDLNKILNDRLVELENSLTDRITKSITESLSNLWQERITKNEENIDANAESIEANEAAITDLVSRVEALEGERKHSDEMIQKLHDDLDDAKNRNMRNNMVIKGFPETVGKEDTRALVIQHLAQMTEETTDTLDQIIDRCHRGGRVVDENKPRNIYLNCTTSRYVDSFLKAARTTKSKYKHDRQYTKPINDRRNAAMLERKRLKDTGEIISGYLEYPAKLMVKKVGENDFKFMKAF